MTGLQLTLPEPPSANRWWRNWRGRMVLSAEARAYKEMVLATVIKQQGRKWKAAMIFQPHEVALSIDWYRKRKAGDLDKRIGIALDALQGIAYETDAQIVDLRARRFEDPKNPRIVVTLNVA